MGSSVRSRREAALFGGSPNVWDGDGMDEWRVWSKVASISKCCTMDRASSESRNAPTVSWLFPERSDGKSLRGVTPTFCDLLFGAPYICICA